MSGRFQQGDLLKFYRKGFTHHGVAVNEHEVVHVAKAASGTGIIRKQKIDEVAAGDKVTSYYPNDAMVSREETAKLALEAVGKPYDYDLIRNNCEHFVTLMATGRGYSKQVEEVKMNAFIAAVGEEDRLPQTDVKRLVDERHTKK